MERLGINAKLYYKIGGQSAGGSWIELTNCRDVTVGLEKGEADVTTRASGGWEATMGALKKGDLAFNMIWDTEDAGFTAFQEAYWNNTKIGLKALDGPDVAGAQGLVADFEVFGFKRNEPLKEAMNVDVTVKITRSDTPPTWQK